MRLGELVLSFDDQDETERLYKVHEPVTYRISLVYDWEVTVPKGFRTDFASLPPITRLFVRVLRQQHRVNSAGVLHDFLYASHGCSRSVADYIFYQEMRERKIPRWQCKFFAFTVNAFGKRAYRTGPQRLIENSPELTGIPIGDAPDWEGEWAEGKPVKRIPPPGPEIVRADE